MKYLDLYFRATDFAEMKGIDLWQQSCILKDLGKG